jgi:pseudaminic acid cytidylyltransferase
MNVAIIPARGGSKRLTRKNILPLGGEALLSRIVKTCLVSQIFSKVIVSTEDNEIALVAKHAGAEVHRRPESLAQDHSTVVEVCKDVLQSQACDNFCCVYATSALLSAKTLQDSSEIFLSDINVNVLLGVSDFNYSPVQALKITDNGFAEMLMPEFMKVQSQFHPKTSVSNGTFCWARKREFLEELTFYSQKLKVFDVPEGEVCDLDTAKDYKTLKRMFERRK